MQLGYEGRGITNVQNLEKGIINLQINISFIRETTMRAAILQLIRQTSRSVVALKNDLLKGTLLTRSLPQH